MAGLNFYSQLQRAVHRAPAKMDGMPAAQWSQWLDSNASKLAVKKEEIEWSGVKEYLALRGKDRLFRDDLVGYLRDNGVQVQEVQLGRAALDPKSLYDGLANDLYGASYEELSDRVQGEIRYMAEQRAKAKGPVDSTKYGEYVIPGGANYREVLITLQSRITAEDVESARDHLELLNSKSARTASDEDVVEMAMDNNWKPDGGYRSSHWDRANILAHLRVDDRLDADGKRVLFINEIQSDWGQDGKKRGFEKLPMKGEVRQQEGYDAAAADQFEPEDDGSQRWAVYWEDGTFSGGYASPEAAEQRLRDAEFEKAGGVPSAPFVADTKAWVGLALKRAILMAVEGGYDRVALISGQQAADLYSLSQQVDEIGVERMGEEFDVFASKIRGGMMMRVLEERGIDAERMEQLVGKNIAQKVISTNQRTFKGQDLKIGGEGMLAFYDQIVPQVAREVLKKLGGEPPEMVKFFAANDGMFAVTKPDGSLHMGSDGKPVLHSSMAKARAAATKLNRVNGEGHKADDAPMQGGMQLGFDITPAMREMVMAGVPLFSLAEGSQALVNPSSPDAMRMAIADLVGLDAEQLQDGVGRLVVTTSDRVADLVQAARKVAFDAWFAGSKVVNQEGRPLVVYHGTAADISAFKLTRNGEFGPAIYTSASAAEAGAYAAEAGSASLGQAPVNVMPVYVNLTNPFTEGVEAFWKRFHREGDVGQAMAVNRAKADGYDGVIATRLDWRDRVLTHYIAFSPEQIKSAIGNRGTYDPLDPDITHSVKPVQTQSPEFKNWFGTGGLVNDDGTPMRLFHGTNRKFTEFQRSKIGAMGPAVYLGDCREVAEAYDGDGKGEQIIMEVYARGKYLSNMEWTGYVTKFGWSGAEAAARSDGWSGVHDTQFENAVAVWDPSDIKSATENCGAYDPRDPDITHSLAAGELPDRVQAFHDRQSGATFFLADRIQLGKEASVFLHETVHRHGKAHLPEGQFDALVGQVKAWAVHAQGSTERSIHDKAAGRVAAAGVSGPVAEEELFAYAVEEAVAMGVQPSALAHEGSAEAWLSAVVQSIQRVADKLIGNSLAQLDGQDLVDLAYALAQVERPELGAVVEQALKDGIGPCVSAPALQHVEDAPLVTDVYGAQIEVNGTWFHAERIFGRAASTYKIGDPVPQLAKSKNVRDEAPDEVVASGLFRESGANVTEPAKVALYAEAMTLYGGWGNFPPVVGRVETVSAADIERYEELAAAGCAHELGFSRDLARSDIGLRYVHLENGHHRSHAATRMGCDIPVYDLNVQEQGKDFIRSVGLRDEPSGPGGW